MHHIAQGNSSQQRTKKICKTACVGTCLPRQPSMSSIALLNKYRKQFIFYEQKRGCVCIVPQAARLQLLFRLLQFFIHAVTFVVAQTYYRVCYGGTRVCTTIHPLHCADFMAEECFMHILPTESHYNYSIVRWELTFDNIYICIAVGHLQCSNNKRSA